MSKPYYTSFFQKWNKVYIRQINPDGTRTNFNVEYKPKLYVKSETPNTDFKTLHGEDLFEIEFNTIESAKEYAKASQDKMFGYPRFDYACVDDQYPYDIEYKYEDLRVVFVDIEVESDTHYSTIKNPDQPVILIQLLYKDMYYVFGTEFYESYENNVKFIRCKDEEDLLKKFVQVFRKFDPDIISGWNCLPLTNSLWLDDKIISIGDVKSKNRVLYNSLLENIFPISSKEKIIMNTTSGKELESSIEHIFPVKLKPKAEYYGNFDLYPTYDLNVGQIKDKMRDFDIYVYNNLRDNSQRNLTWREFIIKNLDRLFEKGVDLYINTPRLSSRISKSLGRSIHDGGIVGNTNYYKYSNLIKHTSKEEIDFELKTAKKVKVKRTDGVRWSQINNLDEEISIEDMWVMGMWYTDGTSSYLTEVSIANTDMNVLDRLSNYYNVKIKNRDKHGGVHAVVSGLSSKNNILLKSMIYKNVNIKSKKKLDTELLSSLSKEQYMAFITGCVDGDGCISRVGENIAYNICNYNENDIKIFHELFDWNGIISNANKNNVYFHAYLPNLSCDRKRCEESHISIPASSNHKNKIIKKQINEFGYYTKIDSIIHTNEYVDMIDIQTNSHYFVSNSVNTHNCQGYDIPMLHERMNLIGLGDTFKKLSPFNYVDTTEVLVFGKMQLRVDIKGIQHLDMIELIKKFDRKKYENYKLDTVAKAVLKKGKTTYDGKLSELYVTDYKRFIEYGLTDVQLVKEIEDAKNLIRMVVMVGYMNKANYIDAFSQVRSWDNQIMIYLKHQDKMQVPYLIAKEDDDFIEAGDEKFEGAYVFHPKTGRWEWVITDDVQSMHPSIIMSFNISPETYLGNSNKNVEFFLKECPQYTRELIDKNATSLANGAMFDNTYEGFLPKIVRRVFNMRNEAKGEYKKYKKLVEASENSSESLDDIATLKFNKNEVIKYDTLQFALKTSIAAVFGFLGNKYSRFYQLDMAEGITLTSQVMLKSGASEIERVVKELTNTEEPVMLYGDTDSVSGDSLIYCNGLKIKIEDLYESQSEYIYNDGFNRNYIKPVIDIYTKSFNTETQLIEDKKINYVMKHKVKKRMYEIIVEGNSVIVTQDHSIIIKRNYRYMSVKPNEITKKDKIIKILNT